MSTLEKIFKMDFHQQKPTENFGILGPVKRLQFHTIFIRFAKLTPLSIIYESIASYFSEHSPFSFGLPTYTEVWIEHPPFTSHPVWETVMESTFWAIDLLLYIPNTAE